MNFHPRFHAEYFIHQYIEELQSYASVFHSRITSAFDQLEAEAERIQQAEYSRLASFNTGEEDDSGIAEMAYFKGVDFYLATDAIRQGIVNLMVAGLFHLFEQHAASLAREMTLRSQLPSSEYPWTRLKVVLHNNGVNVSSFAATSQIKELNLVANTVKHGDGRSADELRALKPKLFEYENGIFPRHQLPLRPLVGEGLRLTVDDFNVYHACLKNFWKELTDSLLPIFCPNNASSDQ